MKRYSIQMKSARKHGGFTLVELMIAMFIFMLVMAAIVEIYALQRKSESRQGAIVVMQDNIRSAMLLMSRDIREAGCDPTGKARAGFVVATAHRLQLTRDIGGDSINPKAADGKISAPEERVAYGFGPTEDKDGNGIADGGSAGSDWKATGSFGRDNGGGFQPIAENIAAVEFNYLFDDGTASTTSPTSAQLSHIAGVQISMLARAAKPDTKYVDDNIYKTAAATVWPAAGKKFNDNYHRRLMIRTVKVRN